MKEPTDIFAAIGAGALGGARKPHVPRRSTLPPLPDVQIALEPQAGGGPLERVRKMRTAGDLRARVAELREHYRTYLQDHLPAAVRESLDTNCRGAISRFRFRRFFEPVDVLRAAAEEIDFETVEVPHVCGPTGKWTGIYITDFQVPEAVGRAERQILHFESVDYACDVYVNGQYVGSHAGFFEAFEFDVTDCLRRDAENRLVVVIRNDASGEAGDKIYAATGLGWKETAEGWVHCPPGAGITGKVDLLGRSAVAVTGIFVRPNLADNAFEVWIECSNALPAEEAKSSRGFPCRRAPAPEADFVLDLYARNFAGPAGGAPLLKPRMRGGRIHPGRNTFKFRIPMGEVLARPWTGDTPHLYSAVVTLQLRETGISVSSVRGDFGFRDFECREDTDPACQFFLNGRKIFLRGANTMGHEQWCVFRGDQEQLIDDILIAKAAHMNFFRLTQRPVQAEVYDYLDRLGMMCQTDLPLFGNLQRPVLNDALNQVAAMERHTRNHPSCVVESLINEPWGDRIRNERDVAQRFLNLDEMDQFFRAARALIKIHHPDRVLKVIDGVDSGHFAEERDVPFGLQDNHTYSLWYGAFFGAPEDFYAGDLLNVKPGVASGCGEYGVEALDSLEVMRQGRLWDLRYPPEIVPSGADDTTWHPSRIPGCQQPALGLNWYAPPRTAGEWVERSQAHQAFASRWMTEAFRLRLDHVQSTAIHLLIDAFSAGWMKSLVSFDRTPKPAYFDFADALAPVAVFLRDARRHYTAGERLETQVWTVNDTPESLAGCRLTCRVFSKEGRPLAGAWSLVLI